MLDYGTLVQVVYERPYYGLITQFKDLAPTDQAALEVQIADLKPTFTVKFFDDGEETIDAVALEGLNPIQQADLPRVSKDPNFDMFQKMIQQRQLVLKDGYYILAQAAQCESVELGNPVPPRLVCATRYYAAENYLEQLFKSANNQFAMEQFRALNCMQHMGVVLGRYPCIPNFKSSRYFGSALLADYTAIQQHGSVVKLGDTVMIEQYIVRLERIVKIESENIPLLLLTGVTADGVPICGTVAQLQLYIPAGQGEASSIAFMTKAPELIKALSEPLHMYKYSATEPIPQTDCDLRYGNNLASLEGMQLEHRITSCAPATPIDVLSARFQFVQNKIYSLETGNEIKFKQPKLDRRILQSVDLNLEQQDQILTPKQVGEVLARAKQICRQPNQPFDYDAATSALLKERHVRCCFCGKEVDAGSVGLIHSIPQLKRPVFQAAVNPPIICAVHKRCAEFCPEVVVQDEAGTELEGFEQFKLDETQDPTLQLLVLDRYQRLAVAQLQKVHYEFIRKAFSQDRIELKCKVCGEPGAVIGCCNAQCSFTAHYDCVLSSGCRFQGKHCYCKAHKK